MAELRDDLIGVYGKAAHARKTSSATKAQLKNAKSALTRLIRASENLAKVAPDGEVDLLRALQGSPLDDRTGERELNEFASACNMIRMDVALAAQALHSAIEKGEQAQRSPGERPKRLRTLVDALADWCHSRGWSLAPTVKSNRRDGAPASCMAVMETFSNSRSRCFVRWMILKRPRSRRPSQTYTRSAHAGATKTGRENTNLRVVQAPPHRS